MMTTLTPRNEAPLNDIDNSSSPIPPNQRLLANRLQRARSHDHHSPFETPQLVKTAHRSEVTFPNLPGLVTPPVQTTQMKDTPSKIRQIPSSASRILDAPGLRDDCYLILMDQGPNDIVAFALGQIVYLYATTTSDIQRIPAWLLLALAQGAT
ncbi:hypothetical protein ON010_g15719 [Phytophthora cinnamomi]|nr:hypothetical protein ON010_g15719 [Phytophthora cinnamomi]